MNINSEGAKDETVFGQGCKASKVKPARPTLRLTVCVADLLVDQLDQLGRLHGSDHDEWKRLAVTHPTRRGAATVFPLETVSGAAESRGGKLGRKSLLKHAQKRLGCGFG